MRLTRSVVSGALWALLLVVVPTAQGSQAVSCPPSTLEQPAVYVSRDVPWDGVVGELDCLPAGETVTSIVIDWGDGSPATAGTATYETDAPSGSERALIHGTHTFTLACAADQRDRGGACWQAMTPTITAVTASDGASRVAGGHDFRIRQPPVPLTDGSQPPPTSGSPGKPVSVWTRGTLGRRSARLTAGFSAAGRATVTLWSARPKLRLRITRMVTAGTRTLTVALPKAWRHALARRPTMRARLRVVLTAGDGASAHDEATLRLSHH